MRSSRQHSPSYPIGACDKQRIAMDQGPSVILSADGVSGNEMSRVKAGPPARAPAQSQTMTDAPPPMALFARLPDELLAQLFGKAKTFDLPAKTELFSAGAP